MKIILTSLLILLAGGANTAQAQCEHLYVDLQKGTLNGLTPADSMGRIKKELPCFTGDTQEGSAFNYGGGVFYHNHDFYFYTHRDYLEVRADYKGKLSNSLYLGRSTRKEVEDKMGKHSERVFRGSDPLPENVLVGINEEDYVYKALGGYVAFIFDSCKDSDDSVIQEIRLFRPKKLFD